MKRTDFLKLYGLTTAGFATGIINPASLFSKNLSESSVFKIAHPEEDNQIILIDPNDEMWVGWLARLVVTSLVTALGAKLVDKLAGDCYCNGTTCSKTKIPESAYNSPEGVYGYTTINRRFVTQKITDSYVKFDNVSVPFLTNQNSPLTHVEGPFLAGICKATETVVSKYGVDAARSIIVPKSEISNGGSKFDIKSCNPTKYKTNYGTTQISYNPVNSGDHIGDVQILVKDEQDNLDFTGNYPIKYT